MTREPRDYSGDKWRQKDRYDHIITEDSARAGYNFLKPRAYVSLTGFIGCAVVVAVLLATTIALNWLGDGLSTLGIPISGADLELLFTSLLADLIWALFIFAPIWMAQGIIRFLLPLAWRPPAIPVLGLYAMAFILVVILDVTDILPYFTWTD